MKSNKNKAQVSLEFLVVLAIILTLFIILCSVIHQKHMDLSNLRLHMTGQRIANTLAENINQINTVGAGYSQYFTLYTRHPKDEFNITFYKNEPMVFVKKGLTWGAPLLTPEVYCCLDLCEVDENKTILHLNSTLTTEVINYNGKIFIGADCL
ncbi:MAG: hypothetical protein U9Q22_04480 [Candidatus Altiarchaeota archaeon]|nr:hypothetical protein [Candidatus Altiarchaeota archaeon]